MSPTRSKAVERHLAADELAAAITDAQRRGDAHLVRRLCFVRNLYEGDPLAEAGRRVGVSQPTASRWTAAWNDGGVEGLRPGFAGGRPPALADAEREALGAVLERYEPVPVDGVVDLLESVFDVSYSRRHVRRLLASLDVAHSGRADDGWDAPAESIARRLRAAVDELDGEGRSRPGRE